MVNLEIDVQRPGKKLQESFDIEDLVYKGYEQVVLRDNIFYHYANDDDLMRTYNDLVYMQLY